MFYIMQYANGSFELQSCDMIIQTPDGGYEAAEYRGKGDGAVTERSWPAGEVTSVVEFTSPIEAERELINRGGEWSSAVQGPF